MTDIELYKERVAGRGTWSATFTPYGTGKWTRTYIIGDDGSGNYPPVLSAKYLVSVLEDFIGSTKTHPDGVRLQRKLPKSDPFFPHCVCESVTVSGIGPYVVVDSDLYGILEVPPVRKTYLQRGYEITATFTQVPYRILSDSAVPVQMLPLIEDERDYPHYWQEIDGTTVIDPLKALYAPEWLRYVDVEVHPHTEVITANAGQYVFDVAGREDPNGNGPVPDGFSAGVGHIKSNIRTKTILMTWYMVPFEYVEPEDPSVRSWITSAIGCINQFDWWVYPKGTLYLDSVLVARRYTPPFPALAPVISGYGGYLTGYFENKKLCDLQFKFVYRNPPREGVNWDGSGTWKKAPRRPLSKRDGGPGATQAVQAGHNLVPFAHTNEFLYIKSKNVDGYVGQKDRPLYPSFPFQLLFTNPGVKL